MDQQPQPTPNLPSAATAIEPPQQQPQPPPLPPQPAQSQSQHQQQPQSQPPSQLQTQQIQPQQEQPPPASAAHPTSSAPNPSPNPTPKTLPSPTPPPPLLKPSLPNPQPRPTSSNTTALNTNPSTAAFSRPWQHHSSQFNQFSPSSPTISSSPSPTLSSQPRGSSALGVPSTAATQTPSPLQSTPFSGSFGHSFGGPSSSNVSQGRPQMQGMAGLSMGSTSQIRASGISALHQQRPSLRPPSSLNSQSPATQNFQGHGLLRGPAVGSSSSSMPSSPQTTPSLNQPWLASGSQGKPPMPPPSYKQQINAPTLQQRSHIPQHHHSLSTVSQQQHVSSPSVPQSISSHQQQEHFAQQVPQSRVPQSLPHQQQVSRAQGSTNQKPSSLAPVQPSTIQPLNQNKAAIAESDDSGGRILSKRSIHDLVNQIDPTERLDPEVEDILVDIAEDFIDSITTFGCSLAKHRRSDTLEAKDILLHLDRNWHMTLPGFSGDEIKTYKKPLTNETHKERLAAVKKSISVTDAANTKHLSGQSAVNAKGNLGKVAANNIGLPKC